jgi:hypothetical protein
MRKPESEWYHPSDDSRGIASSTTQTRTRQMSIITKILKDLNFNINPVHLGEIIIILAILIIAGYVMYSLNLFKKER